MLATATHTNRIGNALSKSDFNYGNRLYPLVARDGDPAAASPLPVVFQTASQRLLQSIKILAETKAEAYRQYSEGVLALENHHRSFGYWLWEIHRAGNFRGKPSWKNWSIGAVAGIEAAIGPLKELVQALNDSLAMHCDSLMRAVVETLDMLVEQKQIGLIRWLTPDMCRFFSYQCTHSDRVLSQRTSVSQTTGIAFETTTQRTQKNIERTYHLNVTGRDLIEARTVAVDDVTVKKPERVQKIIDAIPPFLKSLARIADGTQVRELTGKFETSKERLTEIDEKVLRQVSVFRPDPALTIGHYVLAGWGNQEIDAEENAKIKAARDKKRQARDRLTGTILNVVIGAGRVLCCILAFAFWAIAICGLVNLVLIAASFVWAHWPWFLAAAVVAAIVGIVAWVNDFFN